MHLTLGGSRCSLRPAGHSDRVCYAWPRSRQGIELPPCEFATRRLVARRCVMNRFAYRTRSQLRSRAKLYIAIWLSWLVVGSWVALIAPPHMDHFAVAAVMIPFVLCGRHGITMWAASR